MPQRNGNFFVFVQDMSLLCIILYFVVLLHTVVVEFCAGYWRKQMEHICGHLKAHAADSVNFRTHVAEPRLGKVRVVLLFILQFDFVVLF